MTRVSYRVISLKNSFTCNHSVLGEGAEWTVPIKQAGKTGPNWRSPSPLTLFSQSGPHYRTPEGTDGSFSVRTSSGLPTRLNTLPKSWLQCVPSAGKVDFLGLLKTGDKIIKFSVVLLGKVPWTRGGARLYLSLYVIAEHTVCPPNLLRREWEKPVPSQVSQYGQYLCFLFHT